MSLHPGGQAARFRESLRHEIEARLGNAPPEDFTAFVDAFFRDFPVEEIADREIRDVYACTYLLWQTFAAPRNGENRAAIINPEVDAHGFASHHSLVAVAAKDRPFLVDSLRLAFDRFDVRIELLHSAVLESRRDGEGRVESLRPALGDGAEACAPGHHRESIVYFEIQRHASEPDLRSLEERLDAVMADVALAVVRPPGTPSGLLRAFGFGLTPLAVLVFLLDEPVVVFLSRKTKSSINTVVLRY